MTIGEAADYYVQQLEERKVKRAGMYRFAFLTGANCIATKRHYQKGIKKLVQDAYNKGKEDGLNEESCDILKLYGLK